MLNLNRKSEYSPNERSSWQLPHFGKDSCRLFFALRVICIDAVEYRRRSDLSDKIGDSQLFSNGVYGL